MATLSPKVLLSERLPQMLSMGRAPQSFLGAWWVPALLRLSPPRWRRDLALRLLAISPHYFFDPPAADAGRAERAAWREAELARNRASRERIRDEILAPFLNTQARVLDYGCGPGFLAKAVAGRVETVHAVDISAGALACARVLNAAPNVEYRLADANGMAALPDGALDLVYSIAVVQHVTDEVLDGILAACARVLRPGGSLLLHVNLGHAGWRTEDEWRADRSLRGRVAYQYALHCFNRDPAFFDRVLPRHGFTVASIRPIAELCADRFDDICDDHLLVARRAAAG